MEKKILGISAFFHDSAAALIIDKKLLPQLKKRDFLESSLIRAFRLIQ